MIDKIINPGIGEYGYVYMHIQFDGERLSITGVEGSKRGGGCRGSCGQITDTVITSYSSEWSMELFEQFRATWKRWHLNDMRAGCEHQRAFERTTASKWRVGELCAECGYRYGHAWLFEEVPADVIAFLESLPESQLTPAWV